jgi:DNA repair protein RadC
MDKTLQTGHRERLRKRYLQAGEDGFTDYDLLELLLTYAITRRDVKAPARELMTQFHDLVSVMGADITELSQVPGLGERSALLIILIRDLCNRYLESKTQNTDLLDSMDTLKDYARMKMAPCRNEEMMLVCLDTKNHVITNRIISRGTVDSTVVYPRDIAAEALRCQASGIILIHNHPSGVTEPSRSDRVFTKQIRDALRPLDIRLLDHLIVSRSDVYSFLDHGLLEYSL